MSITLPTCSSHSVHQTSISITLLDLGGDNINEQSVTNLTFSSCISFTLWNNCEYCADLSKMLAKFGCPFIYITRNFKEIDKNSNLCALSKQTSENSSDGTLSQMTECKCQQRQTKWTQSNKIALILTASLLPTKRIDRLSVCASDAMSKHTTTRTSLSRTTNAINSY